MNKRRLRILAKYLRGVPAKHFNLESWVSIDGGTIKYGRVEEIGCQTTACAMGWACSIPSFHRDGLRIKDGAIWPEPVYKRATGMDAAARFFDIDRHTSITLFDPVRYPMKAHKNPLAVARRIETLLAKGYVRS